MTENRNHGEEQPHHGKEEQQQDDTGNAQRRYQELLKPHRNLISERWRRSR
jgi:hypothetical protein